MTKRKRIAYGKVGRTITTEPEKWGQVGGDNEAPTLLLDLARRNPEVDWVCMTKNLGFEPPLPNIINPWREWIPEVRKHGKVGYGSADMSWEALVRTTRFYDELINPAYADLDGIVFWIGQHGSSSAPIPTIADRAKYTFPQVSAVGYSSHAFRGINRWRAQDPEGREETWLIADSRNHLKARDLMWPRYHPILGQFDFERGEKLERYGDPRTPAQFGESFPMARVGLDKDAGLWITKDRYVYSGLELVGIREPLPVEAMTPMDDRHRFGILINEARSTSSQPERQRLPIMLRWVKPLGPDFVYGTWPPASQEKLGMGDIEALHYSRVYDTLGSTISTFTTPSSGSGWATAKPWEAFSVGTICFFHPEYDTQGHIVPTLDQLASGELDGGTIEADQHLARWLRVESPEQLEKRVEAVYRSPETYRWLRDAQLDLLRRRLAEKQAIKMIEERNGL